MNLHSACRVLLSGATLLAATAMATPVSPCLSQPAPVAKQQPHQKQQRPWRNPCYLADAEKVVEEEHNDGAGQPQTVQELLDQIDMLSHLGQTPDSEHTLLWLTAEAPPAAGALPAVPEPATAATLLAGLAVLASVAARRHRQP
jgi:hypothetical protein